MECRWCRSGQEPAWAAPRPLPPQQPPGSASEAVQGTDRSRSAAVARSMFCKRALFHLEILQAVSPGHMTTVSSSCVPIIRIVCAWWACHPCHMRALHKQRILLRQVYCKISNSTCKRWRSLTNGDRYHFCLELCSCLSLWVEEHTHSWLSNRGGCAGSTPRGGGMLGSSGATW